MVCGCAIKTGKEKIKSKGTVRGVFPATVPFTLVGQVDCGRRSLLEQEIRNRTDGGKTGRVVLFAVFFEEKFVRQLPAGS